MKRGIMNEFVEGKAIAVIRAKDADTAIKAGAALSEGGIACLEVALTTPGAITAIRTLSKLAKTAIVGAGTVLTADEVDSCVNAGARFIVSPACCTEVIDRANFHNATVIPGAMTPTEVLTAWRLGADLVKIFPAARLGPEYLSDLHGPFPDIPFVPTGGISDENALAYLKAGATALGFGSWLVDRQAMIDGCFERLTKRAQRIKELVRDYKEGCHGAGC